MNQEEHPKSPINQRFLEVFDILKKEMDVPSDSQLAKLLGMLPSNFSDIKKGRRSVTIQILNRVKEIQPLVDMDYIISGEGQAIQVQSKVQPKVQPSAEGQNQTYINPDVIELEEDYLTGKHIRVLPVVVDKSGKENIPLVTTRAAAGYIEHLDQPEYIGNLPTFGLPMPEFRNGTFRCFPVQGESMLPGLSPGSYVVGRYVENWPNEIEDNRVYIVAYEGNARPVIKRVKNRIKDYGKLALMSDNTDFATYTVDATDVREVWRYVAHIDFKVHRTKHQVQQDVATLKSEMALLRERLEQIERDRQSDLSL